MTEQKKADYISSLKTIEPVLGEILKEQNMHTGVKTTAEMMKASSEALRRFIGISKTEESAAEKVATRWLKQ